jgi:hypothetical protein
MPVPAVRYAMPHLPLIVGFFALLATDPAPLNCYLPHHASLKGTKQSSIVKLDTGTSKIAALSLAMTHQLNPASLRGTKQSSIDESDTGMSKIAALTLAMTHQLNPASLRGTKQSSIGKSVTGMSKIAALTPAMTRLNKKAAFGCFFVYVISVLNINLPALHPYCKTSQFARLQVRQCCVRLKLLGL